MICLLILKWQITNYFSVVAAEVFNHNLRVPFTCESFEFFSPFDQQNTFGVFEIVKRQGVKLTLRINAVEINVVESNLRRAVFMDQGKCGAGHVFSSSRMKTLGNPLDQGCLACAEFTAQQHQHARLDLARKSAA